MCIIYYAQNIKSKNNPEAISEIIDHANTASYGNPDGWGYLLPSKNGEVKKYTERFGIKGKKIVEKPFSESDMALLHLRNSTAGDNSTENTQPIEFSKVSIMHNGIFDGKGYPKSYSVIEYRGAGTKYEIPKKKADKSDTYVFAERINKLVEGGKSIVQALKIELAETTGWWRIFVYDKEKQVLYFTANDESFSLSYNPESGQIVGSTIGTDRITDEVDIMGSFEREYSPYYRFTPEADYIYKIEGLDWKRCDKIPEPKVIETKVQTKLTSDEKEWYKKFYSKEMAVSNNGVCLEADNPDVGYCECPACINDFLGRDYVAELDDRTIKQSQKKGSRMGFSYH